MNLLSDEDLECEEDFRKLVRSVRRVQGSSSYPRTDFLQSLYAKTMERVQERKLAMRTILWVSCTQTLLTTHALQQALVMMEGTTVADLSQSYVPSMTKIKSVCAGLVTVDPETNFVRFVHYTAQEYFISTRSRWFPRADEEITSVCVTYLSQPAFARESGEQTQGRAEFCPLYQYAASYWGDHAQKCPTACLDIIDTFLDDTRNIDESILALRASNKPRASFTEQGMEKIHMIAYFGLEQLYRRLLAPKKESLRLYPSFVKKWKLNPIVNHRHGPYQLAPLYYAALGGHPGMARLLLEDGADVDAADVLDGCTPLMQAAERGDIDMVVLLLKHGANVNAYDNNGDRVIHYAIKNNKKDIEEKLRECGARDEPSLDQWANMYENY